MDLDAIVRRVDEKLGLRAGEGREIGGGVAAPFDLNAHVEIVPMSMRVE